MKTVKNLIDELNPLDPDTIVLYAHNEYGDTGYHGFIVERMVAVNNDNSFILDKDDKIIWLDKEDYEKAIAGDDDSDYYDPKYSVHKVKYVPATMLYSH